MLCEQCDQACAEDFGKHETMALQFSPDFKEQRIDFAQKTKKLNQTIRTPSAILWTLANIVL